jgi:hypothetical protein
MWKAYRALALPAQIKQVANTNTLATCPNTRDNASIPRMYAFM